MVHFPSLRGRADLLPFPPPLCRIPEASDRLVEFNARDRLTSARRDLPLSCDGYLARSYFGTLLSSAEVCSLGSE